MTFPGLALLRPCLTRSIVCALLVTGLVACSHHEPQSTMDTSANAQIWTHPPAYLLRPGDEVEVKYPYSPQLNERQLIRPDGKITLPYLPQDVTATGVTIDGLSDTLSKAYSSVMVNPSVEVILRTAAANRIFVAGEVTRENTILLSAPTTVSRAISMAAGLKPTAARSSVLVIRKLPDNKTIARRVNYNQIVDGADPSQDIRLVAGDIVYVPQTWVGDLDDFVTQFRLALPLNTGMSLNYSIASYNNTTNSSTTTSVSSTSGSAAATH